MTDNGEYEPGVQTQTPPAAPPVPPVPPPGHGASQSPGRPGKGGGGGVTAGVVLILVGVGLLVARFAPGLSLWQLWPLFVIVPGAVQCFTPGSDGWNVHRFFDGLVTVSIGLLLLANTTGFISWSVWWEVLQLWPVLLISAGLGILGKAVGQTWLRVLGTLVVIAALAIAAASSLASSSVPGFTFSGAEEFAFEEPLGAGTDATLSLDSGVGEIEIDSIRAREVRIDGSSPFGEPRFEVLRSNSTSEVEFALTGEGGVSAFPGTPATRVSTSLSEQLPWEIEVDSGVSTLEADLSDLEVSRFQLKTGVSSNTVRLGDAPGSTDEGVVIIDAGIASVKVLVPSDAEVRVETQSGLTGVDISQLLDKTNQREWQTPGFDSARAAGRPVWVITAKSGIGSFAVDTY